MLEEFSGRCKWVCGWSCVQIWLNVAYGKKYNGKFIKYFWFILIQPEYLTMKVNTAFLSRVKVERSKFIFGIIT